MLFSENDLFLKIYFQKTTEKKKKQEIHTIQWGGGKHFLIFADSGKEFSENTKNILIIF
jgi:hypothetical protein